MFKVLVVIYIILDLCHKIWLEDKIREFQAQYYIKEADKIVKGK